MDPCANLRLRNAKPIPTKTSLSVTRKAVAKPRGKATGFCNGIEGHRHPVRRDQHLSPGFPLVFVRRSLGWPEIELPANWANWAGCRVGLLLSLRREKPGPRQGPDLREYDLLRLLEAGGFGCAPWGGGRPGARDCSLPCSRSFKRPFDGASKVCMDRRRWLENHPKSPRPTVQTTSVYGCRMVL